jgi:hypothetical protein
MIVIIAVYAISIGASCLAAQRYPVLVSLLRSSLSLGLLFACVFTAAFVNLSAASSFSCRIVDLLQADVHSSSTPLHQYISSLIIWIVVTGVLLTIKTVCLGLVPLKANFRRQISTGAPAGYSTLAQQDAGEDEESTTHGERIARMTLKLREMQKNFRIPRSSGFNYFDSEHLPKVLDPYFEEIIKIGEELNESFGFQEDSCRNQCEHLLMILSNEVRPNEMSSESEGSRLKNRVAPVARLHARLFFNYRLWCERMSVVPAITENDLNAPLPAPVSSDSSTRSRSTVASFRGTDKSPVGYNKYLKELLLWLFIWGEAGNLKHMPECICFLFHKTKTQKHHFPPGIYVGFYLDAIVSPVYKVLAKELSRKDDGNVDRKTYDDFNEFFWSATCMEYSLLGEFDMALTATSSKQKHISAGLQNAKKTYIEKRSWLHPMLSLRRVLEWHILTFTIIAIYSFSVVLVWEWYYTWQIMSFVFLELSLLNVLWTCLEVWIVVPFTDVSEASTSGYLLRLSWSYIVLIYQTLYFEWALQLQPGPPVGLQSSGCVLVTIGITDCSNYWWWQYIWLSLIASSLYILQSLLCYWPAIASYVLTIPNAYVQSIIQIVYPTSQLYVGKVVHVPQSEVLGYILYWWTLIAFKLFFGYYFIISPLTVPSLQLYDDYMNFGDKFSFTKTLVLLFVWWFPHFLVYNIDLSIWYSVWSSLVGGSIAINAKLGVVANLGGIREKFYEASIACGRFLMPAHTPIAQEAREIMSSKENLASMIYDDHQPVKPSVKPSASGKSGKAPKRSKSVNDFQARIAAELDSAVALGVQDHHQIVAPSKGSPRATVPAGGSGPTTSSATTATSNANGNANGNANMNGKQRADSGVSDYSNYSTGSNESSGAGGLGPSVAVGTVEKMKDSEQPTMQNLKAGFGTNMDGNFKRTHRYSGWHIYSRIWNSIILKLRDRDYLSDTQRDIFLFTHFKWLRTPIYLPLFYTAGSVDGAIYAAESFAATYKDVDKRQRALNYEDYVRRSFDFPMREAIKQSIELTEWILKTLLKDDEKALTTVFVSLYQLAQSSMGDLFHVFNMEKLKTIKDLISSITRVLLGCVKSARGKDKPVVTDQKRKEYIRAKSEQSERERELLGYGSSLKGVRKSQSTGCLQQTLRDYEAKEMTLGPAAGPATSTGTNASDAKKSGKASHSTPTQIHTQTHTQQPSQPSEAPSVNVFVKEYVLSDPPRDKVREDIKKLFKEVRSAFFVDKEKGGHKMEVQDAVRQIQFMLKWDGEFFTSDLMGSDHLDAFCRHPETLSALSKLEGLLMLSQTTVSIKLCYIILSPPSLYIFDVMLYTL